MSMNRKRFVPPAALAVVAVLIFLDGGDAASLAFPGGAQTDPAATGAVSPDELTLLTPSDETLYSGPVPPRTFTWAPGRHTLFRIQLSTSLAFDTSASRSRRATMATSFTPTERDWRKLKRLGLLGRRLYWRVLAVDPETGATFANGQIFSFAFEP